MKLLFFLNYKILFQFAYLCKFWQTSKDDEYGCETSKKSGSCKITVAHSRCGHYYEPQRFKECPVIKMNLKRK